jgi:hypothetical protein
MLSVIICHFVINNPIDVNTTRLWFISFLIDKVNFIRFLLDREFFKELDRKINHCD